MMEWINAADVRILFWLHRLAGPQMNVFITLLTTCINTPWLWLGLAAVGLWKRRSRWPPDRLVTLRFSKPLRLTISSIVAIILAVFVGDVAIKHLVMRIRPYLVIPDAPTLAALKYPVSYSFPSGHSFFFFAGATVFARFNKRLGLMAYVFAAVVAFSRMYLFMHYPSDVFAGAILGIAVGNVSYVLCQGVKKKLSH